MSFYWQLFLGLPKSLYLNFKYFGLSGIRLPILLTWRTKLTKVRGKVLIKIPFRKGIVKIGFNGVSISTFHEWNVWNVDGEIIFEGNANMGTGTRIFVGPKGKLVIGSNFLITANSEICCAHFVKIAQQTLISWDVLLMDTDAHPVRDKGMNITNPDKPIIIEKNTWIGARSIILKGASIPPNSIVAAGSIVTKIFNTPNVIIAGSPAQIVKKDIVWLYEHF